MQKSSAASLDKFSALLEDDVVPTSQEDREKYFMKQLQLGETLLQQGPVAYEASATCFYRALKVFPDVRFCIGFFNPNSSHLNFS